MRKDLHKLAQLFPLLREDVRRVLASSDDYDASEIIEATDGDYTLSSKLAAEAVAQGQTKEQVLIEVPEWAFASLSGDIMLQLDHDVLLTWGQDPTQIHDMMRKKSILPDEVVELLASLLDRKYKKALPRAKGWYQASKLTEKAQAVNEKAYRAKTYTPQDVDTILSAVREVTKFLKVPFPPTLTEESVRGARGRKAFYNEASKYLLPLSDLGYLPKVFSKASQYDPLAMAYVILIGNAIGPSLTHAAKEVSLWKVANSLKLKIGGYQTNHPNIRMEAERMADELDLPLPKITIKSYQGQYAKVNGVVIPIL